MLLGDIKEKVFIVARYLDDIVRAKATLTRRRSRCFWLCNPMILDPATQLVGQSHWMKCLPLSLFLTIPGTAGGQKINAGQQWMDPCYTHMERSGLRLQHVVPGQPKLNGARE